MANKPCALHRCPTFTAGTVLLELSKGSGLILYCTTQLELCCFQAKAVSAPPGEMSRDGLPREKWDNAARR